MRRLDTLPNRINWFTLLTMLQRAGLPASSVADQLSIPKSTILGWKQGAEPKYADGEALVDLWMRALERQRAELPRIGLIGAWR